MQLIVAAHLFVWTGVGDALAAVLPPNIIAAGVHVFDEFFAGTAAVHGLIDVIHQLELPALALDRRPVFAGAHSLFF